jgi:hypothetical protein
MAVAIGCVAILFATWGYATVALQNGFEFRKLQQAYLLVIYWFVNGFVKYRPAALGDWSWFVKARTTTTRHPLRQLKNYT